MCVTKKVTRQAYWQSDQDVEGGREGLPSGARIAKPGEHSRSILEEELGLTPEEIESLLEGGVVVEHEHL